MTFGTEERLGTIVVPADQAPDRKTMYLDFFECQGCYSLVLTMSRTNHKRKCQAR